LSVHDEQVRHLQREKALLHESGLGGGVVA